MSEWVPTSGGGDMPNYLERVLVASSVAPDGTPNNVREAIWLGDRWGGLEQEPIQGPMSHWRRIKIIERCEICRFFQSNVRKCRRHAPRLIALQDNSSNGNDYLISEWPSVSIGEWCGEFEPRVEK